MTVDNCLRCITFTVGEDKHACVNYSCDHENDSLTEVHSRVSHEIDPDINGLHKAALNVKNHHVQDADEHFNNTNPLDPSS